MEGTIKTIYYFLFCAGIAYLSFYFIAKMWMLVVLKMKSDDTEEVLSRWY